MLEVSIPDFLWFVDQALDAMVAIVRDLGDEGANSRPDLPGANSPFVILTHCLGVMEYWGGATVAGRTVTRDRAAEFRARGDVDGLVERTARARRQLEVDLAGLEPLAPPTGSPGDGDTPFGQRQGAVLLHILEELTQHLGHMELTRDMLRA
ncbi:MAG TPA: DUF664 domain-containing protein [Acidimicrobiales bacterium]|nr:DUF664 domain-containing protein [Acidimicrobiales bacterium]